MTYNEICSALAEAEIENNRGEASMLICRFCGINKAELLLRHDEDFDSEELAEAVKNLFPDANCIWSAHISAAVLSTNIGAILKRLKRSPLSNRTKSIPGPLTENSRKVTKIM